MRGFEHERKQWHNGCQQSDFIWYMGNGYGPSRFCLCPAGAENQDPDDTDDGEPCMSNDGHADDATIDSNA